MAAVNDSGKGVVQGNPYSASVWQALNIHTTGRDLHLGSLTPWRCGEALQFIGERYKKAHARANTMSGFSSDARPVQALLGFNEYLDAVNHIDRNMRAYDLGNYLHGDSPALRGFLQKFNPKKYTSNAEGYAQYLIDRVHALGDIITRDMPATLPTEERRRHTYIVGATGSGKSELLKAIVAEHLRLEDCAVVVLDPHVDLARDIAQLPAVARSGRLVYASATTKHGQSLTLNPLEAPKGASEAEKERIAYHLAESLNSLTGGTATSRMVRFFRSAIRVLLDRPGSTLLDLHALTGENPPADIMALGRKHPAAMVRSFFTEDMQSADMRRARYGVRSRLGDMLDSTGFQAFTCGPSTIDLEQAIHEKKVLVFALGSLGKAVGSDVGLLIMAMLTALGERRQVNEGLSRSPVHAVIDECQLMVGESTLTILDEMRKFGVHLTLAQQRAGQGMPQAMKEAVLTAPAVKLCGQTDDAGDLMRMMGIEDRDTPQKLSADARIGLFQFACRWGRGARPFILNVRSDLVGQAVSETEWREIMREQVARYYRPIRGETDKTGEHADGTATESPWELE